MTPPRWLDGLVSRFAPRPVVSEGQRARIGAWRALPEPPLEAPLAALRVVVVDVEATGLSVLRDRLIAIGAVAIDAGAIPLADSFYRVLRQERASSDDNILVHRISGTEQVQGEDPAEVLLGFLEFAGKAPLAGFHSPFDDVMITNAMRRHLGLRWKPRWLDLAWLCPAVEPEAARRIKPRRALDDWIEAWGIEIGERHHALADALASAQLMLAVEPRARAAGLRTLGAMIDAANGQRWASRSPR